MDFAQACRKVKTMCFDNEDIAQLIIGNFALRLMDGLEPEDATDDTKWFVEKLRKNTNDKA